MDSSYKDNKLGLTLQIKVLELVPSKVVEFGVLDGYSTLWIAAALREQQHGHLYSYDLWDSYPFKHGEKERVQHRIYARGLQDWVTLRDANFFDWIEQPQTFDLMHLDISNDGGIIRLACEKLRKNIMDGSVLLFEGGSKERDEVPWMTQFRKTPIQSIRDDIPYKIIDERFPSMSMVNKKCLSH